MKSPIAPNADTLIPKEHVSTWRILARRAIWLLFPIGILVAALVGLHLAARPAPSSHHMSQAIILGHTPVRGVNLGGWLVAEQWINPSSDIWKDLNSNSSWTEMDAAAAYASAPAAVKSQLQSRFDAHRKSWITEDDIKQIVAANFNTLRIPIGYWIGENMTNSDTKSSPWNTFATGSLAYLDNAIRNWGVKYNVSILVDLYGTMDGNKWPDPGQAKLPIAKYNTTLNTTIFLANRYQSDVAFLGIGLLSTPTDDSHLRSLLYYYMDAYRAVRRFSNNIVLTTCPLKSYQHPGDSSAVMSNDKTFMKFMINPDLPSTITNTWMEWQLLMNSDASFGSSIDAGVKNWTANFDGWNATEPLFVGGWNLNVNSNSSSAITSTAQKQTLASQLLNIMNKAPRGWVYEHWKTDNSGNSSRGWGWSLQTVLKDGITLS
ncbi:glucan 1,3-beta-glucosidase [Thraustotheca clavata]|uniref:glucan 1,3-beta-glucosidase n=1 Tax=Thraustotheca clavata TaxID=74557 RepID=A0A1W0A2Q1_9STRA|nr:glucan 1,3-beta-glucosidase [Thraustotheca clavata]